MQKGSTNEYRVAVCQFEPVFLEKSINLAKMEDMVNRAALAGTDLVIFPECSVTGYKLGQSLYQIPNQAEHLTDQSQGSSVQRLKKLSDKLGVQIIFGIPEKDHKAVYNSVVHLIPGLDIFGSYRKVHMWEAEGEVFKSGEEFSVQNAPVGQLGSLICYDLEFPESARILALMGAKLIAVSTANMVPWGECQTVFARSRAMENNVFVAVANCIGKAGSTQFLGGSIIVDPFGRVLAQAGDNEAILIADVNLDLSAKAATQTAYFKKRRVGVYSRISSLDN
jgi:5-aminopentanamidase